MTDKKYFSVVPFVQKCVFMEVFSQKSAKIGPKNGPRDETRWMDCETNQARSTSISLLNLRTTNSQLFKVHYLRQTLFQQVQLISGGKRYGSLSNFASFIAMALAKKSPENSQYRP